LRCRASHELAAYLLLLFLGNMHNFVVLSADQVLHEQRCYQSFWRISVDCYRDDCQSSTAPPQKKCKRQNCHCCGLLGLSCISLIFYLHSFYVFVDVRVSVIVYQKFVSAISYQLLVGISPNSQFRCTWEQGPY